MVGPAVREGDDVVDLERSTGSTAHDAAAVVASQNHLPNPLPAPAASTPRCHVPLVPRAAPKREALRTA